MQRYVYLGALIGGLLLMFYLYLLHFDDYSETELVKLSYYWLPLTIFGFYGLLAALRQEKGDYSKGGDHPFRYAILRTVILVMIMILFFEYVFPGM
ncbi:MAG: hypothetical protein R2828_12660 [Saprospiraceae bacterium]